VYCSRRTPSLHRPVTATAADIHRFGHGNLDVVNTITNSRAVSKMALEKRIKKIFLRRLLPQMVINPVDLVFGPMGG
jgi:hypothetical protein